MRKRLSAFLVAVVLSCLLFSVTAHASELAPMDNLSTNGLSVSGDMLYITDGYSNQIYRYDGEEVTLLAGNANLIDAIPTGGYLDGVAEYTLFDEPSMAIYWNGGVIVSDTQNHVLRFIQDGIVSTYAGTGQAGYTDGVCSESAFYLPSGLAISDDGTLYVADTGNGVIRCVTAEGEVSTYADGFSAPSGLYWYDGVLYVTDVEANLVFSVQDGVLTLVAGMAISQDGEMVAGYQDGAAEQAMFSLPQGIYVDEKGIYVTDVGNNVIRKIASGEVTTVYTDDRLADPVSVICYQENFLIGDALVRGVFSFADESETLLHLPREETPTTTESAQVPAGTTQPQEPSADTTNPIVVIIIGALIVLALLVAIVVVVRRKDARANLSVSPENENDVANQ